MKPKGKCRKHFVRFYIRVCRDKIGFCVRAVGCRTEQNTQQYDEAFLSIYNSHAIYHHYILCLYYKCIDAIPLRILSKLVFEIEIAIAFVMFKQG